MPSLRGLFAWQARRAGMAVGARRWWPPWMWLGIGATGVRLRHIIRYLSEYEMCLMEMPGAGRGWSERQGWGCRQ